MTVIEHFIKNKLGINTDSPLMKEITTYLVSEDYEPHYKLNSVTGDRVYVVSSDHARSAVIYRVDDTIYIEEDVFDLNENNATYGFIKARVIELTYDGVSVNVKPKVLVTDGLRIIYTFGKFSDDSNGYFIDYTRGDGIHGSQRELDFKASNYFSHEFKSTGIWTTVSVHELEKKADHLLKEKEYKSKIEFDK